METNIIIGLRTQSTPAYKYPCPLPRKCVHPNKMASWFVEKYGPRSNSTKMARSRTTRRRPRRTRSKKSARRGTTYRKRTSYRRTSYAKRPSRKAILNATSAKKRNTMLSYTNTAATGAVQAVAPGPAYVNGNATGKFLFMVTAMDLNDTTGSPNLRINQAQRTSTTCYMRGFSEHLRIQTSSGLPWFHRRICFTAKNPYLTTTNAADSPTFPYLPYIETTNGMQRLMFNQVGNNMSSTNTTIENFIFRGAVNRDWNDPLIAPLDSARINIKFDKTWTYRSGNAVGTVKEQKLWHPMNKNLVYDDDEAGSTENTSYSSVLDKTGMGDYYIYDIFTPGTGGTATDQIAIVPNSSLYWHEK
jgi:hypothetical protein